MSHSGIPEAKIMLYVTFPLESIPASFAYVQTYDRNKPISSSFAPGHHWFERIWQEHNTQAGCSDIRPHRGNYPHRRTRHQDIASGGRSTRIGDSVPGLYPLSPLCKSIYPRALSEPANNVQSQVRENIALGDPGRAHDDTAIEEAARLGGASELIARLPDGFDTYLERPVRDHIFGVTGWHNDAVRAES
jgi:hypothetical protein